MASPSIAALLKIQLLRWLDKSLSAEYSMAMLEDNFTSYCISYYHIRFIDDSPTDISWVKPRVENLNSKVHGVCVATYCGSSRTASGCKLV